MAISCLPESLPPERRAPFSWRRANPVGSPHASAIASGAFQSRHRLFSRPARPCRAAQHLRALCRLSLWLDGRRHGPDACGRGCLFDGGAGRPGGRAVAWFGERRALMIGLLCGALGFAIYGLAPGGAWFLIGIPIMSFWGLANPATQGLMTRLVGVTEQGRLQGANSSMTGIAGMIGPGLFTYIFRLRHRSGARLASARRALPACGRDAGRGIAAGLSPQPISGQASQP